MELNLNNLSDLSWNKIGIYKLQNIYNNKIYIGQSTNIRSRLRNHLEYFEREDYKRESEILIKVWKKYGAHVFDFEVLEECDKNLLDQKEIEWIKYYNSKNNGYNMTYGGQANCRTAWFNNDRRKEFSDKYSPKPVLQLDLNGKIIKEYWSVAQASKLLGFDMRGIKSCCECGASKTSKGFIWVYKENYVNFNLNNYNNSRKKRPIIQYDFKGNIIKEYDYGTLVENDGFSASSVNSCCNRKEKSYKGYIWRFKDDCDDLTDDFIKNIAESANKLKQKKIYQFSLNGELIRIYNSLRETEKFGFTYSQVSLCCRHKKNSYKNFRWEFEDIN